MSVNSMMIDEKEGALAGEGRQCVVAGSAKPKSRKQNILNMNNSFVDNPCVNNSEFD